MKIIRVFSLLIILSTLFTLPGLARPPAASADTVKARCSETRELKFSSNQATAFFNNSSSNNPVCYKMVIPADARFVRLEFTSVKGKFNLYRSDKLQTDFVKNQKVNRLWAISQKKSYAIPSPKIGTHTLLIEPLVDRNTIWRIAAVRASCTTSMRRRSPSGCAIEELRSSAYTISAGVVLVAHTR